MPTIGSKKIANTIHFQRFLSLKAVWFSVAALLPFKSNEFKGYRIVWAKTSFAQKFPFQQNVQTLFLRPERVEERPKPAIVNKNCSKHLEIAKKP